MSQYVKDAKSAIKALEQWVEDIEGVVHPDLLSCIESLIGEAEQLADEHESKLDDLEAAKEALEENDITI